MQVEKRLHEIRKMLIDVPLECIINIDELAFQHCTTVLANKWTVARSEKMRKSEDNADNN